MTTVTQWFEPTVKPFHVGLYQTALMSEDGDAYSYWNGNSWSFEYRDGPDFSGAEQAFKFKNEVSFVQGKKWRGLAERAK